jgi:hypothetical protein
MNSPQPGSTSANWRQGQWLTVVEFLLVGFIFYADYRHWIPFSKTPELLLLGWISLSPTATRVGTGRNLWVPIIAHGAADTIDMVLIYYGKMPGM